jgi:hypothetical protein
MIADSTILEAIRFSARMSGFNCNPLFEKFLLETLSRILNSPPAAADTLVNDSQSPVTSKDNS